MSTYFPAGLQKRFKTSAKLRVLSNILHTGLFLDPAAIKYHVKLKESMYVKWEKPNLNQQVKHINLTLSLSISVTNSKLFSAQYCQRNVTNFVTSRAI